MGRLPAILAPVALGLSLTGCTVVGGETAAPAASTGVPTTATPTSTTTTTTTDPPPLTTLPPITTTSTSTTTTTTIPLRDVTGTVTAADGTPLRAAVVTATGDATAVTNGKGSFSLEQVPVGPLTVARPGWMPREVSWRGRRSHLDIELEPRVVRGVRAIPEVAGDREQFEALLDVIRGTTVNALVFDTKDETGRVRYATEVPRATALGAVDETYDPVRAVRWAHDAGLYAITRVVTFEDQVWADDPGAHLAGFWVNPRDRDNWTYPIRLAVEACRLGFDEVQFDYVRFPAGETATAAEEAQPLTADLRVEAIRGFLDQARSRLHPIGCAVSAAVFGIVMSSAGDEGIGQRPEELSTAVDALSPMVYPSHYSPGWLGFEDPNEHPAEVTADALDDAAARVAPGTLIRPWLQGFYWSPREIAAAIAEAEARGFGWIVWNAAGNYPRSALPKT